ncbi:MAG: energy transducer TonB [Mangrovibacterium sp.]
MKRTMISMLCILLSVFAFGQVNQRIMVGEIEVTPPKFAGTEKLVERMQMQNFSTIENYLISQIEYRQNTRKWYDEGTEVVKFIVTADGKVTDFEIINSVSPDIDEEIIHVLKSTEGLWLPGFNNGLPVDMEKEVSVSFCANPKSALENSTYFLDQAKHYFHRANRKLYDKHQNRRALRNYDRAICYMPNDKCLLATRGMCRYSVGDKDGACRDWNRLKSLGGTDSDYYLNNFCEMEGYAQLLSLLKDE